MKLTKEAISYIKNHFKELTDKGDLLKLLNYSKKILYGNKAYPITLKQFNYHLVSAHKKNSYTPFTIEKKSGGDRTIFAPNEGLKVIQRCLNLILQVVYTPTSNITGFVPGTCITDNAKVHVDRNYVFNIDLKDFYYSIDQARIWGRLRAKPFEFSKEKERLEIANMIAYLVCHPIEVERLVDDSWIPIVKSVLPQGAPTSPVMSNIICERLDYLLSSLAKRFNLKYTRYVDDITFSSDHYVYSEKGEFRTELRRIIESEGFYFNHKKTRLQNRAYRQEVTGLIVNKKVNVTKRYTQRLRKWLYLWDNYGEKKALEIFYKEYDKLNYIKIPDFKDVIKGKLSYLSMIKGSDNRLFSMLNEKFQRLSGDIIAKDQEKMKNIKLPVLHSPQKVVNCLKSFSSNNSFLKYSTHSWDIHDNDGFFEYDSFIINLKKEYRQLDRVLEKLTYKLNAKIRSFLFNDEVEKNGWGLHFIKFGWSSPELKLFIENGGDPEDYLLPNDKQRDIDYFGKTVTIQRFKNVIDLFKNEIEVRDDNDVLEKMIDFLYEKHLPGFNLKKFTNLGSKNFYVDVAYLFKSLELIFKSIKNRPHHPDVGFVGIDGDDHFRLEIIHYNSNVIGKSYDDENFKLGKGDFGTISKYLTNLCDWSIESTFKEGKRRINFLVSEENLEGELKKKVNMIEKVEGFKHIFKFYI